MCSRYRQTSLDSSFPGSQEIGSVVQMGEHPLPEQDCFHLNHMKPLTYNARLRLHLNGFPRLPMLLDTQMSVHVIEGPLDYFLILNGAHGAHKALGFWPFIVQRTSARKKRPSSVRKLLNKLLNLNPYAEYSCRLAFSWANPCPTWIGHTPVKCYPIY